jgi:hypothetical protein
VRTKLLQAKPRPSCWVDAALPGHGVGLADIVSTSAAAPAAAARSGKESEARENQTTATTLHSLAALMRPSHAMGWRTSSQRLRVECHAQAEHMRYNKANSLCYRTS